MDNSVTLKMIQEAREALKGIAEVTPIVTSTRLGKNLFIKSETCRRRAPSRFAALTTKSVCCHPKRQSAASLPVLQETMRREWRCPPLVSGFVP